MPIVSVMKIAGLIVVSMLLLISCVGPDGIVTGIDGTPVSISDEQILQKQCELSKLVDTDDLHDRIDGTAIFEGVVVSKDTDGSIVNIKLKVGWVLYGVEADTVDLQTSETAPYGIRFEVGEIYRISAYRDKETLKTWSWMGTYKIKDKPTCSSNSP